MPQPVLGQPMPAQPMPGQPMDQMGMGFDPMMGQPMVQPMGQVNPYQAPPMAPAYGAPAPGATSTAAVLGIILGSFAIIHGLLFTYGGAMSLVNQVRYGINDNPISLFFGLAIMAAEAAILAAGVGILIECVTRVQGTTKWQPWATLSGMIGSCVHMGFALLFFVIMFYFIARVGSYTGSSPIMMGLGQSLPEIIFVTLLTCTVPVCLIIWFFYQAKANRRR